MFLNLKDFRKINLKNLLKFLVFDILSSKNRMFMSNICCMLYAMFISGQLWGSYVFEPQHDLGPFLPSAWKGWPKHTNNSKRCVSSSCYPKEYISKNVCKMMKYSWFQKQEENITTFWVLARTGNSPQHSVNITKYLKML